MRVMQRVMRRAWKARIVLSIASLSLVPGVALAVSAGPLTAQIISVSPKSAKGGDVVTVLVDADSHLFFEGLKVYLGHRLFHLTPVDVTRPDMHLLKILARLPDEAKVGDDVDIELTLENRDFGKSTTVPTWYSYTLTECRTADVAPAQAAPEDIVHVTITCGNGPPKAIQLGNALAAIVASVDGRDSFVADVRVPENLKPGGVDVVALYGDFQSKPYPIWILPWWWKWQYPAVKVAVVILAFLALLLNLWRVWRSSPVRELVRRLLGRTRDPPPEHLPAGSARELALGLPAKVPEQLIRACRDGQCVLFSGSWLSQTAGAPGVREFYKGLIDEVATSDPSLGASLNAALKANQLTVVSNQLALALKGDLMSRARSVVSGQQQKPLHDALGRIGFAGVITTAWDDLLERTFAARIQKPLSTASDSVSLTTASRRDQFFVLKLFGSPREDGGFLFTDTELRRALVANEACSRLLGTIALGRTMFFVGSRLERIESFFESLHFDDVDGTASPRHFALVPVEPDWELRVRDLQFRYGVQCLPFAPATRYDEVEKFLEKLKVEVDRAKPADAGKPALQDDPLTSVRLVNIGPFRDITLDILPGWNVILGNNGCGKSTILRAIAIALCSDSPAAKQYGGDLLSSGAASGYIELRVGTETYQTTLVRVSSGVQVRIGRNTPPSEGRWVALGFPALRGQSERDPSGPGPGQRDVPSADDLLPLLASTTDNRVDDIRQWIVNAVASSKEARPPIIESFFALFRALSPGLSLEFDHVDTGNWSVFVRTADGIVPLDRLSQGMSSVLCWAGTLVQRMHDIYTKETKPTRKRALVLVDELDAHLHPDWQLKIVSLLQEQFPKIQMICTTHSPLIVLDMPAEQVVVCSRAESGGPPRVERAQWNPPGLRVDQVLTSGLFKLDAARNPRSQGLIDEYARLAATFPRSAPEEARMEDIRDKVSRLINPSEGRREVKRAEVEQQQTSKDYAAELRELAASLPEEERADMLHKLEELEGDLERSHGPEEGAA